MGIKGERMQSYRDLIAYQKAYQLSLDIYKSTKKFPMDEQYGLVSQMRRSAVSIPCNIAEGYCRLIGMNMFSFSILPWVHAENWKLCYRCQRIWDIFPAVISRIFINHGKTHSGCYGN
jgi:hypothetical protein